MGVRCDGPWDGTEEGEGEEGELRDPGMERKSHLVGETVQEGEKRFIYVFSSVVSLLFTVTVL